MRFMQGLGLSLTGVLVFSCGCGQSTKAPSALSYSTATAVYTKGVPIAPNSPTTAGGAVTSYSVSPALPAGLSLGSTTGIISGTPTALTALASYTVTASNSAGSTTATLTITVNDQPPSALNYTPGSAIYTKGTQIAPNLPTSSGGAVISYSVSPALPAGLAEPGHGHHRRRPLHDRRNQLHGNGLQHGRQRDGDLAIAVMDQPPSAHPAQSGSPDYAAGALYSTFEFGARRGRLPSYPGWQVGQAVSSVVSPDGNTLLVLTSGFNRIYNPLGTPNGGYVNADATVYDYANSKEYVFVYDISKGAPVQKQVLTIPNSYNGIAFDPLGKAFYVSGGMAITPLSTASLRPAAGGTAFAETATMCMSLH